MMKMLVERDESARRERKRHRAHPPERNVRNEHHGGEPDVVALHGLAYVAEIFDKTPARTVAYPRQRGIFRREIADHPEREFGEEAAHADDQLAVQVGRAAEEGE